ncbi:MAG TPA: hypothetical protein VHB21_08520 [Minicystis sp.]|nr:hypothetical protein [Minicystis sp.]
MRLRADAIADTQSPVGLVVLQGEDKVRPWLSTEALFWAGGNPGDPADLMIFCLHLKAPKGWGDLRAGRFVLATGAVRPVQIDGADVVVRAPFGTAAEAFGGLPVVPAFGERDYDWVAGGRLSQTLDRTITAGVSYVQRRTDGEVSDEEAGLDVAFAPARWFDLAARGSLDLEAKEVSEALVSAATSLGPLRVEAFATHRAPSLLVPATSLFSVLGDIPSELAGGTVRWKAAPRLELLASAAGQWAAGEVGGNGWVRATLALDDRGDGSIGVELRRQDVSTARFTGVRAVAAQKLPYALRLSTELELAVPDTSTDGASAWPWGLVALAWTPRGAWEVAAAVEASSTPTYRYSTAALLRVSKALELQ